MRKRIGVSQRINGMAAAGGRRNSIIISNQRSGNAQALRQSAA